MWFSLFVIIFIFSLIGIYGFYGDFLLLSFLAFSWMTFILLPFSCENQGKRRCIGEMLQFNTIDICFVFLNIDFIHKNVFLFDKLISRFILYG